MNFASRIAISRSPKASGRGERRDEATRFLDRSERRPTIKERAPLPLGDPPAPRGKRKRENTTASERQRPSSSGKRDSGTGGKRVFTRSKRPTLKEKQISDTEIKSSVELIGTPLWTMIYTLLRLPKKGGKKLSLLIKKNGRSTREAAAEMQMVERQTADERAT